MSSPFNTLNYPELPSLILCGTIHYLVDQAIPLAGGEGCAGITIINVAIDRALTVVNCKGLP